MKHLLTFLMYLGAAYLVGGPIYAILGVPVWPSFFCFTTVAGIATLYHYLRP